MTYRHAQIPQKDGVEEPIQLDHSRTTTSIENEQAIIREIDDLLMGFEGVTVDTAWESLLGDAADGAFGIDHQGKILLRDSAGYSGVDYKFMKVQGQTLGGPIIDEMLEHFVRHGMTYPSADHLICDVAYLLAPDDDVDQDVLAKYEPKPKPKLKLKWR